jgi:hypothetical protein
MIHESFANETSGGNRLNTTAERSEATQVSEANTSQFGPRARAIILAQPLNPLRELRFHILSVWPDARLREAHRENPHICFQKDS